MALPLGRKPESSYASSNQVYGSLQPKWNSSIGMSGYDSSRKYSSSPSLAPSFSGGRTTSYPNGYRQNEGTPSFNAKSDSLPQLSSSFSQPSCSTGSPLATLNSDPASMPWKTQSLYNTGEPLGKLSAALLERGTSKFAPSRDAMKDKLVNSLASDTNIAILPGCVKSYEETKMSASRQPVSLNNGTGHSWYAERVSSPVARAQAALADTRDEIGKAQTMLNNKTGKAAGLYRDPRNPGILGGIPGIGDSQYTSVRQSLTKCAYRQDLERQIEEDRLHREAEKNERKNGTQHPFGPSYNSYTVRTDVVAAERNRRDAEKFASYLRVKNDTIGQASPARPVKQPVSDKPPASLYRTDQTPSNTQQIPNRPSQQEMASPFPYSYPHAPSRYSQDQTQSQPSEPQQMPGYQQAWYPPPGYPQQPYGPPPSQQQQYASPGPQQQHYPYAAPTPQQQYYAPSDLQHQKQYAANAFQQQQYASSAHQQHSSASMTPRRSGPIPTPYIQTSGQSQPPKSILRARPYTPLPQKPNISNLEEDLELVSDLEIDESLFITKKWQTCDQLPDPALKRAAYQLGLKKQIIERQKAAELKRLKEIEEEEILERKNAEYLAEMKKRAAEEDEREQNNRMMGHTARLHAHANSLASAASSQMALSKEQSTISIRPIESMVLSPRKSLPQLHQSPRVKAPNKVLIRTTHKGPPGGENSSNAEHGGGDVARVPRLQAKNRKNKSLTRGDGENQAVKLEGVQSILNFEADRMLHYLQRKKIPKSCPDLAKLNRQQQRNIRTRTYRRQDSN